MGMNRVHRLCYLAALWFQLRLLQGQKGQSKKNFVLADLKSTKIMIWRRRTDTRSQLMSNSCKKLVKVIPLFLHCAPSTAHNIASSKEQTRAAFAELKLLFAIIMPQIGWQLPGLLSKNKKMKEMCVIPKSAVAFHFAAVEWWNY